MNSLPQRSAAVSGVGSGPSTEAAGLRPFRVFSWPFLPRTIIVLALFCTTAFACQVPVFRYALERWNADRYLVTVLHDGPLDESQAAALARLKHDTEDTGGRTALLDIRLLDANSEEKLPPALFAKWKSQDDASPMVLVDYPQANDVGRTDPMFLGQLNESTVASILDSPVRRAIAERLGSGDSAVWIFVPCGREADDKSAREKLEQQLKADQEWIELPSPEELEVQPEVLEQVKVPLKIEFSVVTLRRDDPAEQFLLKSLLSSEEDLVDFDEPLAFPVFGRGRVLYALVGKGIASDTIRSASAFMAGPCSCQVKNQNPGFDLLLRSNWKKTLGDVLISEPVERVNRGADAPILLTIPPGRKTKE